jgi:DNA-binding IclR family transcriptional regulator
VAKSTGDRYPFLLGGGGTCVTKERDPDAVFEALCSDNAREILVATEDEPRSAQSLADQFDTSLPTVYRRVNTLVEQDLLEETTQIADDGNHYTLFVSNLETLQFDVERTGFSVAVRLKRDIVDRFGEFWRDLGDHSEEVN